MSERASELVLVVEDDEIKRYAMDRLLRAAGFEVALADSGALGLRKAVERRPDIVLLDVGLPDVSGWEVCRRLKADPDTSSIPVLYVSSTFVEPQDRATGLEHGADGYIVHPFDPRELLATMHAFLRMRRAERERQAIIELIPHVVFTMGPDGSPEYLSPRWTELTGHPESVARCGKWRDLLHPEDRQAYLASVEAGLAGDAPMSLEVRMLGRDETYRWIAMRAVPLHERGTRVRWIGTLTDVHDAKMREAEIARVADFQKQMVSVVGHDLRTPLAAILAGAEMLLRSPAPPPRETLARIVKSARRASRMIGDLLDYTRAQLGGGIPVSPAEADLRELLPAAIAEHELTNPERTIELSVNGDVTGHWDRDRLAAAVDNLLANAFQHGDPDKPVEVRAWSDGDAAWIEVRNQGPIVPSEVLARVFDPFRRGNERGSNRRGLGLGLFIVRAIAEAHGGTVSLESSEDGTVARVRLPQAPPAAEGRATDRAPAEGRRNQAPPAAEGRGT